MNKHDWLVVSTPLKNMNVSWGSDSQYMEKKMFQTTNQMNQHPIRMHMKTEPELLTIECFKSGNPRMHNTSTTAPRDSAKENHLT